MSRVHVGMLIMLGGVLLFGLAMVLGRRADRNASGGKALAVANVVFMLMGIVTVLGGFGFAISSAVFP
jgi:uncharacterized membrane protein YidH (DUF202 family)